VEGAARIGETPVRAREAALITGEENLTVIASAPSVILLVDSPLTPRSFL
jgi:hypothetical protein